MLPIVINVLLVIHVLVSLLIILLVLMQRPKNEGLGAAFGGGATDQLFGAQTTNVLQTITRWLGGMFFVLTLLLSVLYVKRGGGRSVVQDKLTAPTVIPALPTPPPALPPAAGEPAGVTVPGAIEGTPGLDGKGPMINLEQTPPAKPGEVFSEPVTPGLPAPGAEKMPEKTEPAKPEPTPPAPSAPTENKPAEPAPEPKPAEPAK